MYREPESSSLTLPPWGTPTSTSWVTQQGLHKGNHFLGTGESRSFPQETLLLQLGSQSDAISLLLWGPEVLAISMVAPLGMRKTTSTKVEGEHWGLHRLFRKVYLSEPLARNQDAALLLNSAPPGCPMIPPLGPEGSGMPAME